MSNNRTRLSAIVTFIFVSAQLFSLSKADIGTAAHYEAPYLPTACHGTDQSQFPASNLFAAAGEGAWDNGASCGRMYQVRCISSKTPGACLPGSTIMIKIVDRALTSSSRPSFPATTLVLSTEAFSAITKIPASSITIEFQEV